MNKNYNNQNLNEEKSVLSETNLINIKEVKINHLKTPSLLKKQNKPFAKTSNKKVATKNIVKNKGFNQNKYLNNENRILKSKKDSLPKYSFSNKNHFLSNKNMIKNNRNYDNNLMPSSYLLTATNNSFEENLKYSEGTNNSILTNFNRNKKHNPINLTLYSNNSKIYDYSNELYMNTTNDINFTKINAFQMTNHSTQKRNKRKIKIYDPLNTINNTKNKIKKKTKNNRNSYKMNIDKVKNKFNKTVIKSNDDKTFFSDKSLISVPQKNDKNNVKRDTNLSKQNDKNIMDKNLNMNLTNSNQVKTKAKIKIIKKKKRKTNSVDINNTYIYQKKYIIKLQSIFRGFILRKKINNTFGFYINYIKAINILNNIFLSNKQLIMKKLKKKIKKNKIKENKNYNFNYNSNYSNELKMKMKKIIAENNELRLEFIDYKMYKDKYNDIIEENKKIQAKNNYIMKQNIELMKQLRDIKIKNNEINEKNENIKEQEKRRNKSFENRKLQKIINNNFRIQSQVNIIVAVPTMPKKETNKEKKIKNNKEKNELKKDENKDNKKSLSLRSRKIEKNERDSKDIKKEKENELDKQIKNVKIKCNNKIKEKKEEEKLDNNKNNIKIINKQEQLKGTEKESQEMKDIKNNNEEKKNEIENISNENKNNKNKDKAENINKENKNKNNDKKGNINNENKNNTNNDKKENINNEDNNDKNNDIKENISNEDKKKVQIDLEILEKKRNFYQKKLLKDLVKIKDFKYREMIQKYLLRYYYIALYLKKLDNINKFKNNESNKIEKEENINIIFTKKIDNNKIEKEQNINIIITKETDNKKVEKKNLDTNTNNNDSSNDLRIDYKNKHLYTEEDLKKIKRNKELRDLFYNKIRERQNYIHKCFTRFYYKGLMFYMKNKNKANNKTSEEPVNNPNISEPINNPISSESVNNSPTNTQKFELKRLPTIKEEEDTNKSPINDTTKEEPPKAILSKSENPHTRARGLRKLLNKKAKEKIELLRKYFYKFQRAGILSALRKGTKRASLYKQVEGIDLETAFNTVMKSQTMNEIEVNEESNAKNFQEALQKKMSDIKFAEEMEKNRIEEEKKKKEEEERQKELKKIKSKKLEIIFYKTDKKNKTILKKKFEVLYLKSKILSLCDLEIQNPTKLRKSKTLKKKKKKRNSVIVDSKHTFKNSIKNLQKVFSTDEVKEENNEDEDEKDKDIIINKENIGSNNKE